MKRSKTRLVNRKIVEIQPITVATSYGNQKENVTNQDQLCNICAQNVPGPEREKIFAFGKCDHYVCYVCSARLRVICEQSECPICREKLDCVLFTSSKNQKSFNNHNLKNYIFNEKYKIYYENESMKEAFEKLLKFECQKCLKSNRLTKQIDNHSSGSKNNPNNNNNNNSNNNKLNKDRLREDSQGLLESSQVVESKFEDVFGLKNHLNYVHNLKLCDLCLTHNKLFPFEYSYYDKVSLKEHTEKGEENTSHRGHPNCALCYQIFFNAEELLLHMSREHYHCHICARDDANHLIYFLDYRTLREHFKSKHILCERDNCKHEQFTSVFANEIEEQLHLVQFHPSQTSGLSRGEIRHQRTITLQQPAYRIREAHSSMRNSDLPPNTTVVSTGPVATANSNNNSRQQISESIRTQLRHQRLPAQSEFPALGQNSNELPSQALRITNFNNYPNLAQSSNNNTNNNDRSTAPANNSTLSQRLVAGPSNSGGSFVRSLGGGYRPAASLNEMDFPPLPEQPVKPKSGKKPKSYNDKLKNDKDDLTLEQLISSSLTLSNRNKTKFNGKKSGGKGGSAKANKKVIKIQL